MANFASGSRSVSSSLKYLVRVLLPLPGFPSISNRLELFAFDHSLYFESFQSHSNVPADGLVILLKRELSKRRLERHSVGG